MKYNLYVMAFCACFMAFSMNLSAQQPEQPDMMERIEQETGRSSMSIRY